MKRTFAKQTLLTGFAAIALFAGCSSSPRVPDGARLIWYGSSELNFNAEQFPTGTFYLTDSRGKTVSAIYRGNKEPVNWSGLKPGKKYRLYFVEGPRISATTRPAN